MTPKPRRGTKRVPYLQSLVSKPQAVQNRRWASPEILACPRVVLIFRVLVCAQTQTQPGEAVEVTASWVKATGKRKWTCLKEMHFIITNNSWMETNNHSNLGQEAATMTLGSGKLPRPPFSCLGRALAWRRSLMTNSKRKWTGKRWHGRCRLETAAKATWMRQRQL